ncbi:MAG: glycosyltransferase family 4 protein [Candidatus Latescibacterota bacterium]
MTGRRPLKILQSIVLHGWNAGAWYAVEFSKALQRRGHEVLILTPEGGIPAQRAREAGLPVDTSVDLKQWSPAAVRRNVRTMRALLARERFDVINAHWGEDHLYWALVLRFLVPEAPPLVRIRSVNPRLPKRHPLNKVLNRYWTDLVLVSNRFLSSGSERVLGLDPGKVAMVYPGLDVSAFSECSPGDAQAKESLGIDRDALVVGLIARFSKIKGHRHFIEAAGQVARSVKKVVFLIVGFDCGVHKEDLEAWASKAGIADRTRIVVLERVQDLSRIMAAVDLGVISSIGSEAISRITMEYMATGKPMVCTTVGGIPELVVSGQTGLLVPPAKPAAMAQAMIALLSEPEGLLRMGAMGRKRMEQRFSIETQTDEMEEVLYALCQRV